MVHGWRFKGWTRHGWDDGAMEEELGVSEAVADLIIFVKLL